MADRLRRFPGRASAYFADGAIEVVVTRLDLRPAAVRALAAWLSDAQRQRAGRINFDRNRRRFVVTRARVRQLLGVRLDVRPESVELVANLRSRDDTQTRSCDSTYRIAMMSPCTPSRPDAKSESTLKPFVSSAMPTTSRHAFLPAARMRLTWPSTGATSRRDFQLLDTQASLHQGARRRALPAARAPRRFARAG